jgi:hypothetical protein
MTSPSRVWAFSRTNSSSRAACQLSRSTIGGTAGGSSRPASWFSLVAMDMTIRRGWTGHQIQAGTADQTKWWNRRKFYQFESMYQIQLM